jgi:hypothetical protein
MNVTSYLPDELVQAVDQIARQNHSSRSAVVKEALEHYLKRFRVGSWPDEILAWRGDPEFPPFESVRGQEQRSHADPFGDDAGK